MARSPFIWLQHALPQHRLSKLAGRFAESENPAVKDMLIRRFVRAYAVDMAEAEQEAGAYRSFNEFFTRSLKPGARPIADPSQFVVSPADGAISQLGGITGGRIIQAKGREYSARTLLGGDDALAERFEGGQFATIYLSPSDYHRVHMPVAGTLRSTRYVPGKLYSVNTATAAGVRDLFARNERLVSVFDTGLGSVASVMVGAMIVASIETVWGGRVEPHGRGVVENGFPDAGEGMVKLEAGAEMGRFLLGSTVVLLFEPGKVEWLEDLGPLSVLKMGEAIGRRV